MIGVQKSAKKMGCCRHSLKGGIIVLASINRKFYQSPKTACFLLSLKKKRAEKAFICFQDAAESGKSLIGGDGGRLC